MFAYGYDIIIHSSIIIWDTITELWIIRCVWLARFPDARGDRERNDAWSLLCLRVSNSTITHLRDRRFNLIFIWRKIKKETSLLKILRPITFVISHKKKWSKLLISHLYHLQSIAFNWREIWNLKYFSLFLCRKKKQHTIPFYFSWVFR